MRFHSSLLCLILAKSNKDDVFSDAFSVQTTTTTTTTSPASLIMASSSSFSSPLFLSSSNQEGDEYDDWYADFDPSDYEVYNKNENTYGNDNADYYNDRGRGGGGGGYGGRRNQKYNNYSNGGHDYTRDDSVDSSNVDVEKVDSLISERLQYRKTGRFDEADAIRDELLDVYGVMVRDKDRVWRSGCSRNGSGSKWMRGGGGGGGNNGGRRGARGPPRPREFGPNGHDYELSQEAGPNTSSFTEDEIHALLKERLECKMARDFRNADAIQQELLQGGVYVHDGFKQWRADGTNFEGYGSKTYQYVGGASELSDEQSKEIKELIEERARFKAERLYRNADAIRDELRDRFRVVVDDRKREWMIGDSRRLERGGRDRFSPFTMADFSEQPDNQEEIQELVEKRDKARADRDFATADDIREHLLQQGVTINDKLRQWTVGGFPEVQDERKSKFNNAYIRRGGAGSLTSEDEERISSMLAKRDMHKRNRKFKSADAIRDQLREEYNIQVDDRNREWHVVNEDYVQSKESMAIEDPNLQEHIEYQVAKRLAAKLKRDYETADAIRDELMEKYNVSIDDRVREWSMLQSHEENEVFETASYESESEDDIDIELDGEIDVEASSNDQENPNLEQLTVVELKERLRTANLPVSGNKAELIERLTASS